MDRQLVYLPGRFTEIRDYIKNGLPEDHFSREYELETSSNTKKVWHDTDFKGKHEYDEYSDEVKHAARFRDGLVSDIYTEFREDFGYSYWTQEYKKHSTIVFRFLLAKEEEEAQDEEHKLCTNNTHTFTNNNGLCHTALDSLNLMQYHMAHIEGYQSQSYMRDKLFSMLRDDINNLPKSWSKTRSITCQLKYIHSLAVVLYTLNYQQDWITFKVYGSDDFETLFEIGERIQNVLSMLIKDNLFDHPQLYRTFIYFTSLIHQIDKLNDDYVDMFRDEGQTKIRFFTNIALKKYDKLVIDMKAKYGDWGDAEASADDDEEEEEEEDVAAMGSAGEAQVAHTSVAAEDGDKENTPVSQALINQPAQVASVDTDAHLVKQAAESAAVEEQQREGVLTQKGRKKAAKMKRGGAESEAVAEGGSKVKRGRRA